MDIQYERGARTECPWMNPGHAGSGNLTVKVQSAACYATGR